MERQRLVGPLLVGGSVAAAVLYIYFTSSKCSATKRNVIAGLYNLGNTCYANALIQGLSSIPSFVDWLARLKRAPDDKSFVANLRKLILDMESSNEAGNLSAAEINASLIRHGWRIGVGSEQDLHELFNVFLSTWEEELSEQRRCSLSFSLADISAIRHSRGEDGCSTVSKRSLHSLLMERCAEAVQLDSCLHCPCNGIFAVQLKCLQATCGFKKVRRENFSVIPLMIPKAYQTTAVTLDFLLRHYFCSERIKGASCDACKLRQSKSDSGLLKRIGIAQLPGCLLLRVERVGVLPSGVSFKISQHVNFPPVLDVRDYCFYRSKLLDPAKTSPDLFPKASGDSLPSARMVGGAEENVPSSATSIFSATEQSEKADKYLYELRAVSEHRGVPETGHFVTYRRGSRATLTDRSWFLTNDTTVTRVPWQQVASAQAYMLYYQRVRVSSSHPPVLSE